MMLFGHISIAKNRVISVSRVMSMTRERNGESSDKPVNNQGKPEDT